MLSLGQIRPFNLLITIMILIVIICYIPINTISAPTKAGENWCGTMQVYAAKYEKLNGFQIDPEACTQQSACDAAATRDQFIPAPEDAILYIDMVVHLLAMDDGSNLFSNVDSVQSQVDQLNADFAQAGIQFRHTVNQINSTAWRTLDEVEIDAMKSATAINPATTLNVWVTVVNFSYSFGTFPWSSDSRQATGGIVMGQFHWVDGPNRVFAHEVGHTLGLYHIFNGVDEVTACGPCYESPGIADADHRGDRCADTPPQPTNSGGCSDPGGNDPCTGFPWGTTMPENYMSYAAQTCLTTFTPQQRGRMRCYCSGILDAWVDPFYITSEQTFGSPSLTSNFSGHTHKTVNSWNWDFGDGAISNDQEPSHTYQDPGYYTVTVDLDASGNLYNITETGFVSVESDSIFLGDGDFNGDIGSVPIFVTNFLPLEEIIIPFQYSGPIDMRFDSISSVGTRTEFWGALSTISDWFAQRRATVNLRATNNPFLPPGSGQVGTLYFTKTSTTPATNQVTITPYIAFVPKMKTYAGEYTPDSFGGSVSISCCQGKVGNVDGIGTDSPTVGDISAIIDHLFGSGTSLWCYPEGDANQSGGAIPSTQDISVADITAIIDNLFGTGNPLNDCL